MKSTHQHRKCGGEVFTQEPSESFPYAHCECFKCGNRWSLWDFETMPYDTWKKTFIGFHPAYAHEEVFVEISQGKKCFTAIRKRGALFPDGTIAGEEGTWRTAKL